MGQGAFTQNTLFYGDNLKILRDYLADESVDLIYLDPPFNSNRDYNVLFKEESGTESEAQIIAFEDMWHWSESPYRELQETAPDSLRQLLETLVHISGRNRMTAYLVMMSLRIVELHRILKPAGSLYLHCDPTASHYLKLVLDTVFGPRFFQSQIIWKRSASHGGAASYHDNHDVILYFSKTNQPTWNSLRVQHDETYIKSHYTQIDEQGRRYQLISAHGAGQGPARKFGDKTIEPPPGRHWMSQEHIDNMMQQGNVVFTKTGMPRYKRYLDVTDGSPLGTVWHDIFPVNSQAKERLGYPAQKPVVLLERIIEASSNEGDIILDPFCGCGTTVHAAQKLKRTWIGIDITHLAVALIKNRLKDAFNIEKNKGYTVIGEPEDIQGAIHLAEIVDRYQFQWWAISLISARPYGGEVGNKRGKKGADSGIDGIITFNDDPRSPTKRVIVQVKSGKVSVRDIRDLRGTLDRENHAEIGVFITLQKPSDPMKTEAESCGFYHSPTWHKDYPKMQILTIEQLLNGESVKMPPTVTTYKKAQKEQLQQVRQRQLL